MTRDLVLIYQNTHSFDHYPVAWESATALGPEHSNLPFQKFSSFLNCGIKPVTPIMENTEVYWSKPLAHAGKKMIYIYISVESCPKRRNNQTSQSNDNKLEIQKESQCNIQGKA